MPHFEPGKIVKTTKLKTGQALVIRYPRWSDLQQVTDYINCLSQEHTFIRFSGEKISLKEETEFFGHVFTTIELGDMVQLHAVIDNQIVGVSSIERNTTSKKRSLHVGIFGISIAIEHRSLGIGQILAQTVINEVKWRLEGLRLITLSVYEPNVVALELYTKLGFVEAGTIPGHILHRGEYVGQVTMYLELD